ncbi:hypothetical protein JIN84_02220 [Luteolibacter yonseiensis]|uniref:Uncharacterized protein n=1 Tax=Luteolibacter yonseiensis TaxID=1144680 RepID=A0A934R2P9_9BACT|nr:hypothetical protein [Luteolibacter yonseiensis]MBK1814410.1 hypothetical protein [Luteolibacter yonseiensis]
MTLSNKSTAGGLLACAIIVLAWFSPWLIGGLNLAPQDITNEMMRPWRPENADPVVKNHFVSDGADQSIVYRIFAQDSYRREGWVGWSTMTYGGTAQYANTMGLYYDWTMQLHRFMRFWEAWNLGLLGQVLVAMTGMFLFLRGRDISLPWVCCGALAYAANSQFVVWVYHRWALGSFCWIPWALWAVDAYGKGRRWTWALVPIFIGLAFLGGNLQYAIFSCITIVAIWVEESWRLVSTRFRKVPDSELVKSLLKLLGRYAAWGCLALGLAAMMFLPCVDAFFKSDSLKLHIGMYGRAAGIYPVGALQPLFNLAAYPFQIFPSVLGRCDSIDILKGFKSELFFVAYFGSLPVLIAFLAFWRRQTPVLARVLIWTGLLLPLTPLVRVLYQRLFLLFILGGILAFAHFMETASRETKLKLFKITSAVAGLGIAVWTAASLVLFFKPGITDPLRTKILAIGGGSSFGYFSGWMARRTDNLIHDFSIWSPQQMLPLLLLVAALMCFRLHASLRENHRRVGSWLLVCCVVAEVGLFGSRWIVWTDPQRHPLFPDTADSLVLQESVGHSGRVTTLMHPTGHMACTPFIPNTLSPYGVGSITGYDTIVPDGMLLPNESSGDAEKQGRAGVSHLITWPGNPDVPREWNKIWSSPSMDLYDNPLKVARNTGFKNTGDKDAFFSGNRPPMIRIQETTGGENHRLLEVPAGVSWIRTAENEDDGWEYKARSATEWQPVLRAPDASMLFPNPSPDEADVIEMRYNPPLRRAGFITSASTAALVLCIGAWVAISGRKRTSSQA